MSILSKPLSADLAEPLMERRSLEPALPGEITARPAPRVTFGLWSPLAAESLAAWVRERVPNLQAIILSTLGPGAALTPTALRDALVDADLLVLFQPEREDPVRVRELLGEALSPHLITIDASCAVLDAFRNGGASPSFQLRSPCAIETVGEAIVNVLTIHLPLRDLCRRAVGRVGLRDALDLMRSHMLREAVGRTGSKRAAARALGVTRPAVQQMLRLAPIGELPSA